MDTTMLALQVRTAIPFGYLFLTISWVVWMSALTVILIRSIHRRRIASWGSLVSMAGLCLGAVTFFANIVSSERLELNPSFSEDDLFGSWEQGASILKFENEGTATFYLEPELRNRLGVSNGNGYWEKTGDFDISIGNQRISQTAILRAIRYQDELRIIIQDYADWDMWDRNLGFRKSTN